MTLRDPAPLDWARKLQAHAEKCGHEPDRLIPRHELRRAIGIGDHTFRRFAKAGLLAPSKKRLYRIDDLLTRFEKYGKPEIPGAAKPDPTGSAPPFVPLEKEAMRHLPEMAKIQRAKDIATERAYEAYQDTMLEAADEAKAAGDLITEVMILREFARKENALKKLLRTS